MYTLSGFNDIEIRKIGFVAKFLDLTLSVNNLFLNSPDRVRPGLALLE